MSVQSRAVLLPVPVRALLTKWDRARKTDKDLAERSRILLLSADGLPNKKQAALLGVDVQRIRRWTAKPPPERGLQVRVRRHWKPTRTGARPVGPVRAEVPVSLGLVRS